MGTIEKASVIKGKVRVTVSWLTCLKMGAFFTLGAALVFPFMYIILWIMLGIFGKIW